MWRMIGFLLTGELWYTVSKVPDITLTYYNLALEQYDVILLYLM